MNTTNLNSQRLPGTLILRAGGLSILAAIAANVVARLVTGALIPLDPAFQPFSYGAIIFFTLMFTLIGVGVLALINRIFANPLRLYNIVGAAALVISILPNFAAAANPSMMPMGGAGSNYLTLILFHIVAAAAFLGTLNILAKRS